MPNPILDALLRDGPGGSLAGTGLPILDNYRLRPRQTMRAQPSGLARLQELQQKAAQAKSGILQPPAETVAPPTEPPAEEAPADEPMTLEDFAKYIDEQQKQYDEAAKQLENWKKQLNDLDPTQDPQTILSLAKSIPRLEKALPDALKALEQNRATLIEHKAKASVAEGPGALQQALGIAQGVAEAPGIKQIIELLSGAQENVAGLGSIAAQAVGQIGGPNEYAKSNIDVGFGDVLRSASPLNWFDEDTKLRQRGREFNEKVGVTGAIGEKMAKDTPVLGNFVDFAQGGLPGLLSGGDINLGPVGAMRNVADMARIKRETMDEMKWSMGFSLATDPLNVLDAAGGATKGLKLGYEATKATELGQKMLQRFPSLLKPEKFWLRMTGRAKEAEVLGDPLREQMWMAQQAFEDEKGFQMLKAQQQTTKRTAEALKGLNEVEVAKLRELAPEVIEQTTPEIRAAKLAEAKAKGDHFQQALFKYSDVMAEDYEAVKALEQKWGLNVVQLTEDLNYVEHQMSGDLMDWFANHPLEREQFFGKQIGNRADDFHTAWLSYEKTRKLTGGFHESESTLRDTLRELGVPDKIPVWERNLEGNLVKRIGRSFEEAKLRHLQSTFGDIFAKGDDAMNAMAEEVVKLAAAERASKAADKLSEASEGAQTAFDTMQQFREGRAAVRQAGAQQAREAREIPAAADQFADVSQATTDLRASLNVERSLRKMFPGAEGVADDAEDAMRAMADVVAGRVERPAALRRAANAAKAEASRAKKALDAATKAADPAAVESAKRTAENAQRAADAADRMAREAEKALEQIRLAEGGSEAAKQARSQAKKDYFEAQDRFNAATGALQDAANRDMQDATKRLLAAQKALKTAKAGGDPAKIKAAEEAVSLAGEQAKQAREAASAAKGAAAQAEKDFAEAAERIDEAAQVASEAKGAAATAEGTARPHRGGMPMSRDAQQRAEKATKAFYDDYQNATKPAEYRRAVDRYRKALEGVVPPKLAKDLGRMADDAIEQLDRLGKAEGAVGKPVAKIVNQAERDSRKAVKAAQKAVEDADPNTWAPKDKAGWVRTQLRKQGLQPPMGKKSLLDILEASKQSLPNEIEDLAHLAVQFVDAADEKQFLKYVGKFYWQHMDTPTKLGRAYDAAKGIYQRSVLGRASSLTKDVIGTLVNGVMSGNVDHLNEARRLLGSFGDWQKGLAGKSDIALELQAKGVLMTTKGEAQAGRGGFGKLARQYKSEGKNIRSRLAKIASRIEDKGVLGAMLPGKASKTATKATDALNDARNYWEEVNRVATYIKALKDGASKTEAVEEVFKWWGKFNELTKLDKKVLSRIFFFWAWMLNSVPITIRHLIDHPVRSKLLLMLMAGNVSGNEDMPDWIQRMGGVILGSDKDGNAQVLGTGGSTYFSPTFSALQGDFVKALSQGRPIDAAQGLGQDVIRSSPPFVQSAGELVQGMDYFTGKDWRNEHGESQIKAPIGMYWLKDTALGKLFNLKEQNNRPEEGGGVRYVTMSPEWAWFFGALPGVEPAMQDLSSFVDPRKADVDNTLSLRAGALRQAGLPVYSVHEESAQQKQLSQIHKALQKEVVDLPGHALAVSDFGNLYPNPRTDKGALLKADIEKWKAEAQQMGQGGVSDPRSKAYVDRKLAAKYPDEFRILDLWRRKDAWGDYLSGEADPLQVKPTEKRKGSFNRLELLQEANGGR